MQYSTSNKYKNLQKWLDLPVGKCDNYVPKS